MPCHKVTLPAQTDPRLHGTDSQARSASSRLEHNTHNAQSTHKSTTMASLVQGGVYRVRYGTMAAT